MKGWKEMQQVQALRGGVAPGSATARAALAGRSLMDDSSADESDDIDAAGKVNAIKARALEARNRRRRTQDRAKAELYERRRAQKISRRDKHAHGPGMGRAAATGFGKGGGRGGRGGGGGGGAGGSSGEEEGAESPGRHSRFASGTGAGAGAAAGAGTSTGTGGSGVGVGVGAGGGGAGESLEEKVAALKDQIPHLPIAQEYRLYLERQGGRVPHFLRGVDLHDPECQCTLQASKQA